jgi:site-specific DNA recombinase
MERHGSPGHKADPAQQGIAVIYARVSSKEQEKEGFSIPAQLKLLRGSAAEHRLTVVEEFVDVETAKRSGRPGFTAMVEFFKKHAKAKTAGHMRRILLVEKTDRLYRNLKDWVTLDDLDLEIHFVKENVILAHDSRSSEKFMHGIKVLMAKNYIDNLSEEASKGMLEKAEQGFWPSSAPLGYRNIVGPNGRKTIEPDPDVSPIVSRLFEWYATGNYSLEDITTMAQTAGLVSRRSKSPLPRGTIHKILRNRIYMGDFEWKGRIHQGIHVPLITRELWEGVQKVLDHRFAKRHRKVEHDFAFSRLIACGHCSCSLVSEIKKGRYIYYHCTGFKGKCHEPYVREEVLEVRFTDLLKGLAFDEEIMGWMTEALRQSHEDERRDHAEAMTRLQAEYARLQNRIEAMYVDKLDGRVDTLFFDRKAAEWRAEQDRLMRAIESHQAADQTYLEEGIRLLELGRRAHELFQKQEPREKRRLLDFVLSNCTWKDGELQAIFRQPFDLIIESTKACAHKKAAGAVSNGLFENWRG